MQVFFGIAYFIVGIVQLFAVMDGIEYGIGLDGFFNTMLALFLAWFPIVGSAVGVYGAINVWDWSFVQAGVLFFWYVPVFIIVCLVLFFTEK